MHLDADCPSQTPPVNDDASLFVDFDTIVDIQADYVADSQQEDRNLCPVIKYLNNPTLRTDRRIKWRAKLFSRHMMGTLLPKLQFRGKPLVACCSTLQKSVIQACHDDLTARHLGLFETFSRIWSPYLWNGMYHSITTYVGSCNVNITSCQLRCRLVVCNVLHLPRSRLQLALTGPFSLPTAGKKWKIATMACLTRYAETKALSSGSASKVASCLSFTSNYSPTCMVNMRILISNYGRCFTTIVMENILKLCHRVHKTTAACHPKTNGIMERINVSHRHVIHVRQLWWHGDNNWDLVLPFVYVRLQLSHSWCHWFSTILLILRSWSIHWMLCFKFTR